MHMQPKTAACRNFFHLELPM